MRTSMSNWKTTMKLSYNDGCITADQIKIKRGIFQGDSFSPLLFCLALVPLTSELATSGYGYKILNTSAPISNLFYMDDLKLYSKNEQEQVGELKIVKQFSDDIGMEFGLEKCAKASFMKGKLASTGNGSITLKSLFAEVIIFVDKRAKEAKIIDIAIRGDARVKDKELEKIEKSQFLEKRNRKVVEGEVKVVPIVIEALGAVSDMFEKLNVAIRL